MNALRLLAAGGDSRQTSLVAFLRRRFIFVDTVALGEDFSPRPPYDGLLLPLPVLRSGAVPSLDGTPLSLEELARLLKPGGFFLGGVVPAPLRDLWEKEGFLVGDFMEDKAFVWENALFTARAVPPLLEWEGLERPRRVLIVGGGMVSRALQEILPQEDAALCVCARSASQRESAARAGHRTCDFAALEAAAAKADLLVNTVPAPVLHEAALKNLPRRLPLLDLASAPGGVDLASAARQGFWAKSAPGLPGRFFPAQAGEALARSVLRALDKKGGDFS